MLKQDSNSPAHQLACAFLARASAGLYIISGAKGAGKTTFCREVVNLARQADLSVGGLLCPAVYKNGNKVGIDQENIASGEHRRLGMRSKKTSNNTIGCWSMDEDVIRWGNEIIAALRDEELIIIDELGPLEFEAGSGYQQALRLLDEKRYRIALVVVRPELMPVAQARWPHVHPLVLQEVKA